MLSDISLPRSNILDDVLVELGKINSLTRLDIRECEEITDAGIETLVKGCGSNLKFLLISKCTALTNASLSSITEHCPNLEFICLGENHKTMTLIRMTRLVQKCEKLVEFKNDYTAIENGFDVSLIDRILEDRRKAIFS